MRYSENIAHIAEALALVQAEIKNPIKNQTNKGVQGEPKYANLEDTLQDYVRPVCSKHGIAIFQSIKTDEIGRVGVCTVLLHESGEYIEGDYVFCEIKIPVSKSGYEILTPGQATGVNITYLRRYSLNAALGINGDKDTDGGYDKHAAPAPKAKAAPAQTPGDEPLEVAKPSSKEWKQLYNLAATECGASKETIDDTVKALYGCEVKDLNVDAFQAFRTKIEKRAAKMKAEREAAAAAPVEE
jgi:hypothetical protein